MSKSTITLYDKRYRKGEYVTFCWNDGRKIMGMVLEVDGVNVTVDWFSHWKTFYINCASAIKPEVVSLVRWLTKRAGDNG